MQGTGAIVRVLGACDHAWMRRFHVVFALFAGACTPACPPGLMPGTAVDLYYGRGGVAEADWQDYLERSVVARFPDGMTVFDGAGRWRDPAIAVP